MTGVSEGDIDAAESVLGVRLPADYRELLLASNGVREMHAEAYVDIWPLEQVVEAHNDDAFAYHRQAYPGLLIIGGDGAGELLAYDTRQLPFRVVLVNHVSSGWHEACEQKPTITALLDDLRAGNAFSFTDGDA